MSFEGAWDYLTFNVYDEKLVSGLIWIIGLVLGYIIGMAIPAGFTGTADFWNRDTGAGTGLWFNIVRPFDTAPREQTTLKKKEPLM